MNTLLLIVIVLVVTVSFVRGVAIIVNPARKEKFFGGFASALILLPIGFILAQRDYYFLEASIGTKASVIVFLFIFFLYFCYTVYKEYVLYKLYLKLSEAEKEFKEKFIN